MGSQIILYYLAPCFSQTKKDPKMEFSSVRYPFLSVKVASGRDVMKQDGTLQPAELSVFLRFNGGILEVNKVEYIEALLRHPSYNVDFYGPFSTKQIKDKSYKPLLAKYIRERDGSDIVPDIEALKEAAITNAAKHAPAVSNIPINDAREMRTVIIQSPAPAKRE